MSDLKKYSAREAAVAVLKKAEEMLKSADKSKHDRCVEHVKENSPEVKNPHAVCVAEGVNPANWSKSEDAQPVGEIHPNEHVEGEKEKPGARIEHQVSPEDNPKEQKEGNNIMWGTEPSTYGTLKLAHFMGHMAAKRAAKNKKTVI